ANLPRGARVWTFGTERHADDDGWSIDNGRLIAGNGHVDFELKPGTTTLLSPPDQVIRSAVIDSLIVGLRDLPAATTLRVLADSEGASREFVAPTPLSRLTADAAGVHLALTWPADWREARAIASRLRIEIASADEKRTARVSRIVAYPRAEEN